MQEILNSIGKDLSELIITKASGNTAEISFYKRRNNIWEKIFETEGFIGKNGLGKETEGDLKTPVGLFGLGVAFGINENPGTQIPYIKLTDTMYWVDDINSKYYNQLVDILETEKDWNSAEHLITENIAYEYAVDIKFNHEYTPNRGSAVFIHCSKGKPTAGCVAIPTDKMEILMKNITKNTKIHIY